MHFEAEKKDSWWIRRHAIIHPWAPRCRGALRCSRFPISPLFHDPSVPFDAGQRREVKMVQVYLAASPRPESRPDPWLRRPQSQWRRGIAAATRLSVLFESQGAPGARSKRLQERIPERAFHRAEKLKACCVNNEAERIGISADPPLSALAGRNAKMVFSLDWQIHERRFAFPLKPSLMASLPPSDIAASLVRESAFSSLPP